MKAGTSSNSISPSVVALIAAAALTFIGILAIATVEPDQATKQVQWLVISLIVAVLCALPHPRRIGLVSYPLMLFFVLLLFVIILPFMPRALVPVRNGARCWINLGFMMFQPSELAKVVFILALARYLRFRDSYRTIRGLLVPFVLMFVPMLLILKQPDLGMAILFPPALFAVLVAAGAKLRHLGTLIAIGVTLVVVNVLVILYAPDSMQVLRPHQRDRIRAMVSQAQGDRRFVNDIGFQQDRAMTLIGAGGLHGYGPQRSGLLIHLNGLPEDHNDMIFVVIVNRWGLLGGAAVVGLFALLVLSFMTVASRSKDPVARLACVGFAAIIFTQMVVNVGMTVGLLPITGITLPLVSYGGSSLMATYAMIGLVLNFGTARPAIINRPTFEFDTGEVLS